MSKCALVLEGGGNRGIFTSGVLDAFMEESITFPYVIGVSYGSCNGASFLGKNIRRQHDMIINYTRDKRYMGIDSMIKNGEYLNLDWDFGELTYEIMPLNYENFENSNAEFCVVVSNAKTAEAEYLYPKDLRKWGCEPVKASCAMPLATKGVKINGETYFDGGITDSIPLEKAYDDGCDKAVVILTRDRNYVKQPMKGQAVIKHVLKQYPKLAEALLNRDKMYMRERHFIADKEKDGKALTIYPPQPLNCTAIERNVNKLETIYQMGYNQGKENLEKVKEYINE